jgi:hypothetical protein
MALDAERVSPGFHFHTLASVANHQRSWLCVSVPLSRTRWAAAVPQSYGASQ